MHYCGWILVKYSLTYCAPIVLRISNGVVVNASTITKRHCTQGKRDMCTVIWRLAVSYMIKCL